MTLLARDLALLRIPFDSWRLYRGDDPFYELWLAAVHSRVAEAHRMARNKAKLN